MQGIAHVHAYAYHVAHLISFFCFTGGMNHKGWMLHAITTLNTQDQAVPLAYMIASSEAHGPVATFIKAVKGACPEFKPQHVVIDMSATEALALEISGLDAQVLWCWFHVVQAWTRYLKGKVANEMIDLILEHLRTIRHAPSIEQCNNRMVLFQHFLTENGIGAIYQYFTDNYVSGNG